MRTSTFFYLAVLLTALLPISPTSAESLIELQRRILENAREVTDKAKTGDSEIQDFLREHYDPQSGSEVNQGVYDPHPLRDGSPNWAKAWIGEDTAAIAKHFVECLDIQILGLCGVCDPICNGCAAGVLIQFWWPEAAFETNDYCQGQMMDLTSPMVWGPATAVKYGGDKKIAAELSAEGCFIGDTYRKLKDELINGPLTNQLKDSEGERADIPKGLRDDPNWGRSRIISDQGQFFETHAYRTWLDRRVAKKGKKCVRQCFPTPHYRFPVHASETPLEHMLFWRFPELSSFIRPYHAEKWRELFGELPFIALSVGAEQYGTSMSPIFPHTAAPMLGEELMRTATCSSYRATSDFHSDKGRAPIFEASNFQIQPGIESDDYKRLCFPTSQGQLFPLTGYIPVVSHKTSPLGAGRRLWEIGSADRWTSYYRFNYFNDYNMKNLYRNRKGKTKAGRRLADKWQRVYPEVSECFNTKNIDALNTKLFPHEMEKTSLLGDDTRGEDRYIHWNRKTCCITPKCCPWLEE